jgi:hypothetical protein
MYRKTRNGSRMPWLTSALEPAEYKCASVQRKPRLEEVKYSQFEGALPQQRWRAICIYEPLLLCFLGWLKRFCFTLINPYDRFRWAVAFTGAALHTQANVDMGLRVPIRDGIAFTSCRAGTAQYAKISYLVRHDILLKEV